MVDRGTLTVILRFSHEKAEIFEKKSND